MIFITAFITGLIGSLHCAGMCGPIAILTPTVGNTNAMRVFGKVVYNAGRIISYGLLGALLGAFGFGLKLAGMQQSISIIAGVIVVLSAVLNFSFFSQLGFNPFKYLRSKFISQLFQNKSYTSLLLIGLLNGLLPCGFVYIGLIASVATQSVLQGFIFMVFFGLGTFPMMLTISVIGQFLNFSIRAKLQKVLPILTITIGLLFILRGLNLGIPYISPQITANQTEVKSCCVPK